MDKLRQNIDNIDDKIMELLIQRLAIVKDIGKLKKTKNIPIEDKSREKIIIDNIEERYLLEPHREFLKSIYNSIFKESKNIQNNY